jgi:hypothetical protein
MGVRGVVDLFLLSCEAGDELVGSLQLGDESLL